MSEEKNKLFSEPIITSDDKFDQDYTIDNNGVDFNPNEESLYPDEPIDEPTTPQQTKEIPTKSLDEETKAVPSSESDSDHRTYNTGDIFQTEPINNYQEAPIEKQNNYYTVTQPPIKEDYEDEPETTDTKWWIIGGIALIVLICLSWFLFFRAPSQSQPPETKTEEIEKTVEEVQEPEETDNQEEDNNSDNSNSYQDNSNNSRPSSGTYNNSGSSSGLSNSSDNAGYSNNSSNSSTYNQDQSTDYSDSESSTDNTYSDTTEDTDTEGSNSDNQETTDTSTETSEQAESQETQDYSSQE